MRWAILLGVCVLFSGCVSERREASLSNSGDALVFGRSGATRHIQLPSDITLREGKVKLISHHFLNEADYLFFELSAPSRPSGDGMGYCGSGVEAKIVWLALHGTTIIKSQQRLVTSCIHNIEITAAKDDLSWNGNVCQITFWELAHENQKSTLRFDSTKPSDGFIVTEVPFN